MPYVRRVGDGVGLPALGISGFSALAVFVLAGRNADLWQAARLDGLNAAFLALCVAALGIGGNALGILALHRVAFTWRWWLVSLAVGLVLGTVAIGFGWSLPLCLVALGGGVMVVFEIFELCALPFELGHGLLKLARFLIGTTERAFARRDGA